MIEHSKWPCRKEHEGHSLMSTVEDPKEMRIGAVPLTAWPEAFQQAMQALRPLGFCGFSLRSVP